MKKNILTDTGMNLLTSIKVCDLPPLILDTFHLQKIPFENDDILYLMASGGKLLWESLAHPLNEHEHPIDNYSIEQMKKCDPLARILFPHQSWNIPLQRLGRVMNLSRPSLLGLDINDEYGVWFAFRGAFLSKQKFETRERKSFSSPCESCQDKPCISACPASAVNEAFDFKINKCADHRLSKESKCTDICRSRIACPYKSDHRYSFDQIRYHMTRIAHIKKLSDYTSS